MNSGANKFCGRCGAVLTPPSATSPQTQQQRQLQQPAPQPAKPGSRRKLFLVGGLIAAVLFVGAVALVGILLLLSLAGNQAGGGGTGGRSRARSGLDGLYVGTESSQRFNPQTQYYDYVTRQVYYLFLPDGHVYYGLPKGGSLDDFDFARAQQADPQNCGSFRVSGGKLHFDWPRESAGSRAQDVDFSGDGDSVRLGKTVLKRVDAADGLRLDGTYSRYSFTNLSGGGGVSSGGVAGQSTFVFRRDGTFSQQGFVGFSGSNGSGGAATSEESGGSGTYSISGNTLEVTYADGRRGRFTFFVYPGEDNLIVIDGLALTRRS
jgi:hypothetical protein